MLLSGLQHESLDPSTCSAVLPGLQQGGSGAAGTPTRVHLCRNATGKTLTPWQWPVTSVRILKYHFLALLKIHLRSRVICF